MADISGPCLFERGSKRIKCKMLICSVPERKMSHGIPHVYLNKDTSAYVYLFIYSKIYAHRIFVFFTDVFQVTG